MQSSAAQQRVTLDDNYLGGLNTYNGADVIGTSDFNIVSATVGLTTTNLTVTINTNYAGQSGLDGTTYGSLFIGSSAAWTTAHSDPLDPAPYPTDQYHPGEWSYAVVAGGTTNGSSDGLYAISGAEGAHNYGNGVTDYYTTSTGNVVMSNVGGNPTTVPNAGSTIWYFRQGQSCSVRSHSASTSIGAF